MIAWLGSYERRLYASIEPPDVVFLLVLDAEEAIRRDPDHNPEALRREVAAVREARVEGARVVRVDAGRSEEDVQRQVRGALFDSGFEI